MKNFLILFFISLVACGPNRSFEGKNLYGSEVAVSSSSSGTMEYPWPEGDQGVGLTQVVPENLEWQGYVEYQSSSKPTTLYSQSWYDPTGELGINAVLVIVASHDCAQCKEEAEFLENRVVAWKSQGRMIKVITLLVDDKNGGIVSPSDALDWKNTYYQISSAVGADPLSLFIEDFVFAYPYHAVINPRSMRIIETQEGLINKYSNLEKLADSNKL